VKLVLSSTFSLLLVLSSVDSYTKDAKGKPLPFEKQLRMVEGDYAGNELKALKAELLISENEQEAMGQLNRLLAKYRRPPVHSGLMFRKAELYMRMSKSSRFFELKRDEGDEAALRFVPQAVKKSSTTANIKRAIETYEGIAKSDPHFRDLDLVYFNNGFARQQINDLAGAEKMYRLLISKMPESPLIPDSYLAIGEMRFDKNDFKAALKEFESVKRYPAARVYPYGVYKAAWSKYNLNNALGGLKELEEVVDYSRRTLAYEGQTSKLDLRKEALRDMVLFYSDVRPAKDAFKYFRSQAGDAEVGELMLRLASLYRHHSRHKDLEIALLEFIDKVPNSDQVPEAVRDLVVNYETLKNRPMSVEYMRKLKKECLRREGSVFEECQGMLSEASNTLARKWHGLNKKNANIELSESAIAAYQIYLGQPRAVEEYHETRFFYAELLFQINKFREASVEYEKVALHSQDAARVHDSSYAALVSMEKAAGEKWSDQDENRFVDLAKIYLDKNPKGEHRQTILFKSAFIAYEKGRIDEAEPQLFELAEKATGDVQRKSQDLYLDILNIKKKYAELKVYSDKLLKKEKDVARKEALTVIYQQSYFAEIQSFESGPKLDEAVTAYTKFAKSNKNSPLASKAWFNAISLLEKKQSYFEAANMYFSVKDEFPSEKSVVPSLEKAADLYESMGDLDRLEQAAKAIVERDKKNRAKWEKLAADIKLLRTPKNQQMADLKKQLKTAKGEEFDLVASRLEALEKIDSSAASYADLMTVFSTTSREPYSSQAVVYQAEMKFESKDYQTAFRLASQVVGGGEKVTNDLKARARLIQAKVLDHEFRAQSVKSRLDRLAVVLAIKTEKLDKAQQAYQSVIRYKDPETAVDAMAALARCYGEYARALRLVPESVDAPQNEKEALSREIESLAAPMDEKYVESIAQAYEQAKKFHLFDHRVRDLKVELDKLNFKQDPRSPVVARLPAAVVPRRISGVQK